MTTDTNLHSSPLPNGQAGPAAPASTNPPPDASEQVRLAAARESFAGRLLTDPQFDEAIAITQILEREIYKSGSFKNKLKDYAYAMALNEKMDARRLESAIRDLFRERTGRTMNQMREAIKTREERPQDDSVNKARLAADDIERRMSEGDKIAFNRAFAEQAQTLADEYGVTDNYAKTMMKEAFESGQGEGGVTWEEWSENLENQFYRPQIEAEKAARAEAKEQQRDGAGPMRTSRRR